MSASPSVAPVVDLPLAPLPRLAYSPAEVATVVGLSRSKVMALLADGTIASVKIDRSRRVLHDDLVAWLEGLREGSS